MVSFFFIIIFFHHTVPKKIVQILDAFNSAVAGAGSNRAAVQQVFSTAFDKVTGPLAEVARTELTYGQTVTVLNRLYDNVPADASISVFLPNNLLVGLPVDKLYSVLNSGSEEDRDQAFRVMLTQEEKLLPAQRVALYISRAGAGDEPEVDRVFGHAGELPEETLRLAGDFMGPMEFSPAALKFGDLFKDNQAGLDNEDLVALLPPALVITSPSGSCRSCTVRCFPAAADPRD